MPDPNDGDTISILNLISQNIETRKKYQWQISNYCLLLYGAIIAIAEMIELKNWIAFSIFIFCSSFSMMFCVKYLWKSHKDLMKYRDSNKQLIDLLSENIKIRLKPILPVKLDSLEAFIEIIAPIYFILFAGNAFVIWILVVKMLHHQ